MAPRIFAVCIGINFYPNIDKDDESSLSGCVGDCDSFVSYLTDILHVPASQITRLTSTKDRVAYRAVEEGTDKIATYANISNALLKLSRECKEGDQVLVTYSGHGNRLWSIVSSWRGKENRMDETLVPMDGLNGGRELRDFELSYLLSKIAETKCHLTVVLDSCHSGGAFRDAKQEAEFRATGLRARTIFKTMGKDPTAEERRKLQKEKDTYPIERPLGRVDNTATGGSVVLGVSLDDLQAHWNTIQDKTEKVPKNQLMLKPLDYDIWTGCLAHELSWEFFGRGRLTAAIVDSLKSAHAADKTLSSGMIYRNVYDLVYGKNTYTYYTPRQETEEILQTPLLLGDVDKAFLKTDVYARDVIGIPIRAIPFPESLGDFSPFDANKLPKNRFPTLVLRAGAAHGVQKGSEYDVYLWHENLNTEESPVRVVVTEVGTIASVVRVVGTPNLDKYRELSHEQHIQHSERMEAHYTEYKREYEGYRKPPQVITYPWPSGCQAVLIAGPSDNVKRVRLVADGGSAIPAPWDGERNTYVRAEVPLLVVSEGIDPSGEDFQVKFSNGQYAVHDGSDGKLLSQADSVDKALRNIVQISQYRSWLGITETTTDPENTDLFTLEQISRTPVQGDSNLEEIKLKLTVSVEYVDLYNKLHLNVAIFNFSPTFGIRQIYPFKGQFESVDAGHFREFSFQRQIPPSGAPGGDFIKAIIYQSSTGFKAWEVPELGAQQGPEQPVRVERECKMVQPAPERLGSLDAVPGPRPGSNKTDAPAAKDGDRVGYGKYWVLQIPVEEA